jgi:hypothetical protein
VAASIAAGIRQLVQVDGPKARTELEKHVTTIRMVPQLERKEASD